MAHRNNFKAVRFAGVMLIASVLLTVEHVAAQNVEPSINEPTVGQQGGKFGIGFASTWPAYGVSGTLQVNEAITAEAILGFFGTVSNFGGRAWYRFNRNPGYDLYGYAGASVYRWSNRFISEDVLGVGAGVGIEGGLQKLFDDETFPPIFVNAEFGLAYADFEFYDFSAFLFGMGIHYRFGN